MRLELDAVDPAGLDASRLVSGCTSATLVDRLVEL